MWKPFSAGLGRNASSGTCGMFATAAAGRRRGCMTPQTGVPKLARCTEGARCGLCSTDCHLVGGRWPGVHTTALGRAHMEVCTQAAAHASRRRSRAALGVAALCAATATMLFSAGAAPAAITTGPVDPASGFPFSYTDDVQRFGLEQCQDASGFCIEAPRPQPDQPISVPGNYTSDGEGVWWLADAEVPNAGTGLARFAKESAFDNDVVEDGHQVSFSRIRFRFTGLIAGDTYRVTHPYGVTELVADPAPTGGGRINFTNDVGCIAPPCGAFPALANDPITAFLRWDPTVAPAAPDGYIGNASVPHRVIGSPLGTDFVRLEHVVAQTPPLPPVL